MSPSSTAWHQRVLTRIAVQIASYLEAHPVGEVLIGVDVHLGTGPRGGDLVYRPDIVFINAERAADTRERIVGPPDLIVEVVSSTSRRYDNETKKGDYQRCGVGEYWVIDPQLDRMAFYYFREGSYVEIAVEGGTLKSEAIPGFALDLARVRKTFKPM